MFSTVWILPLILAFFVLRMVVRRGVVRPNVARGEHVMHRGVNPNPELDRGNTSPLAILQRWQSGIGYHEFFVRNQNNPSGGK